MSNNSVNVRFICSRLAAESGYSIREGVVHSVFHSSLNCLMDGRLITILDETRPLYPYSVVLEGSLPACQVGDFVACSPTEIRIGNSVLSFQKAETELTQLNHLQRVPSDQMIISLRECILENGKRDGFYPLMHLLNGCKPSESNLYADFAAPRILTFLNLLKAGKFSDAADLVPTFAGCGIGLTPSADDFLCGVLASLYAEALILGKLGTIRPFLSACAEKAVLKTNPISGTFIEEAASGLFSRDVRQFFETLYSSVQPLRLRAATLNVIAFGETSGTDILTGIYYGQINNPFLGGNGIG